VTAKRLRRASAASVASAISAVTIDPAYRQRAADMAARLAAAPDGAAATVAELIGGTDTERP
jgi:UDP:flavonoid glycosyltransferase YjiC (YdhE family)